MKSMGIFVGLAILFILGSVREAGGQQHASTPPRGWNSYDSYSWIISEQQFLSNAERVAQTLLPFGYQYVVVDFLWFRKREPGASVSSAGYDNIDEWGRPIPDPARWPSSSGGRGFRSVADQVHSMGLKFGIHVMRGISTQAVQENTPILGKNLSQVWRARDIALLDEACSWMSQCFLRVNESSEGGKAFIQSLYDLYASWEVDFVKHDCVFGSNDFSSEEITAVSQAISTVGRPMLYSISPGVKANPPMAVRIGSFVNMYRVTADDWDTWPDLHSHFDVARDFAAAGLIGAPGLLGFSWPDLDMLPIGFLTDPGVDQGPHRWSRLSLEEQRTQMTLWGMARSPLMFGGDLLNINGTMIDILTNKMVLEINANSYGNREVLISNLVHRRLPFMSLLDCRDAEGTYWELRQSKSNGAVKLCWTHEGLADGGCFHWKPAAASFTSSREKIGQILMRENLQTCLDAEGNARNMFSPCSPRSTQIWHVNTDNTLVNNVTKLCAAIKECEHHNGKDERSRSDIRLWMARGVAGEYYVAAFNLQEESIDIFLPVNGIVEAGQKLLQTRKNANSSQWQEQSEMDYRCQVKEAWSDEDMGTVEDTLHATLHPHGCALFSLLCT